MTSLRSDEPCAGYYELTAAEVIAVLSEGDDDRAKDVRSLWSPDGGAARPVPACEADAQRIEAGVDPDAREIVLNGRSMPYWNAPGYFGPWAGGYFGGFGFGGVGGFLPGLLFGSMLGGGPGGGLLGAPLGWDAGGNDPGGWGGDFGGGWDFGSGFGGGDFGGSGDFGGGGGDF